VDKQDLIGKEITPGWVIQRQRLKPVGATGGCNSLGYVARNSEGREAFVKVLDVTLDADADDPLADLKRRLDVFEYERSLLERCKRMSLVVSAIESGAGDGRQRYQRCRTTPRSATAF